MDSVFPTDISVFAHTKFTWGKMMPGITRRQKNETVKDQIEKFSTWQCRLFRMLTWIATIIAKDVIA